MATISIPIETKVREFDGKLWLAACLAQDGHEVIFGEKSKRFFLEEVQPDLHLTLSLTYTESRYKFLSDLKHNGTKLGVLDTEGGVFVSEDAYYSNRVSEQILDLVDVIFAWGEMPANIVVNRSSFPSDQVIVSGNPRFDLLHPELRGIYEHPARSINNRIGEFILFNTNFTIANHHDDERAERIRENRDIDLTDEKIEHQAELLDRFIEAIRLLSNSLTKHTIVIRPHPSENHEYYRDNFQNNSAVHVEHSGDVRAWIYGADCVVHNSCTTGIESAMLNTPVIAFEPKLDSQSYPRPHLPNMVSITVQTQNELETKLQSIISKSELYKMNHSQLNELEKYFANTSDLAAPRIATVVTDMTNQYRVNSSPELSLRRQLELWIKRHPLSPFIQQLRSIGRDRSGYRKQKFPGLSIDEVKTRIMDFEEEVGDMDLLVSRINYIDDIYLINTKSDI